MTWPIYCVAYVSGSGVATLVTHTGSFVRYSHVDVLAALPIREGSL